LLRAAAAFCIPVPACVIDQNATHDLRGNGKEMRTVGPMHVLLIYDANVSLVDQGGGLQSMAFPFPAHVAAREPVQLVVDQRIQLVERGLIAIAPFSEQLRDLVLRFCVSQLFGYITLKLRDLAWLAQHLVHFADVQLFLRNHAASVVFEQN
jgi:hypothetical protein